MKLRLTFSAITLFFVCSIAFIPQMILSRVARVDIAPVARQEYQETVFCNGEVIEKNSREIYLDGPVIASDVRVSVGDRVWRGQTLATVDTHRTKQILAQGVQAAPEQESAVPDEVSALARRYGLTDTMVQSALEQQNSVPIVPEQVTEIPAQITAPISGIVTAVNVKTDVLTPVSKPVITVSDDSSYAALVSVNEADIAKLAPGNFASITGIGFGGEFYTGSVLRVYPVARKVLSGTTQQTVVDVELSLDGHGGQIRPGYSVKASIFTQDGGELLTVPYEAVGQGADNLEYVYVYARNRVEKRMVKTGRELTESLEVLEGLSEGEQVVLNPGAIQEEYGLYLPRQGGGTQ